jgi:hypothetical protein
MPQYPRSGIRLRHAKQTNRDGYNQLLHNPPPV